MLKKLAYSIFFGNYFYGLCTVGLSVEANLQQDVSLNSFLYYILVFLGTVVYYTHAYIGEQKAKHYYNTRSEWYANNYRLTYFTQIIYTILIAVITLYLIVINFKGILHLSLIEWISIVAFPVVAGLYYGVVLSPKFKLNLRSEGWLKPFIIGFVWAGAVTIYPIIFRGIEKGITYTLSWLVGWLFLKNWMYITVLCIMFDIKDYAADHNKQLKTFVVQVGLRRTIFTILIPLTLIGLASFIVFAITTHFPLQRILINIIPFIALIVVAYSLHERKKILYYLAVIDGLMLVKAACGIAGVLLVP
ncbi:MAG: hypothetical protein ACTHJ5_10380 [Ilyomonas sp.]